MMKLKKYIPFIGGLVLFVVALGASNGPVNLTPQEAQAEDQECTPNAEGYCIEIFNHKTIKHSPGPNYEPATNPKDEIDFVEVVWRAPNQTGSAAGTSFGAKLMLKREGTTAVELGYRSLGYDTNGQYETEFIFPDDIETANHSYDGYTVYAVLKLYNSENLGGITVFSSDHYSIPHANDYECNNDVDDDNDWPEPPIGTIEGGIDYDGHIFFTSSSPIIALPDPNCIAVRDNSERESVECSNGKDDDNDGKTDLDDPNCTYYSDLWESPLPSPSGLFSPI